MTEIVPSDLINIGGFNKPISLLLGTFSMGAIFGGLTAIIDKCTKKN
jgi:hypothetical protein